MYILKLCFQAPRAKDWEPGDEASMLNGSFISKPPTIFISCARIRLYIDSTPYSMHSQGLKTM